MSDKRFQSLLRGDAQPTDNAERLAIAQRAFDRGKFSFANRLWMEVLGSKTELDADLRSELAQRTWNTMPYLEHHAQSGTPQEARFRIGKLCAEVAKQELFLCECGSELRPH